MSAQNKALIKRWFEEVWNKGNVAAIDEMYDPEGVAHGLGDDPDSSMRGPEAFKPFHKKLRGALSNLRIDVVDLIAEGDKVVARCKVTGTHTGETLGVAATNKRVIFEGVTIGRIVNGKIMEGWNHYDFMRLYKDIGLL